MAVLRARNVAHEDRVRLHTVGGQTRFIGKEQVAHELARDVIEHGLVLGADAALTGLQGLAGAIRGQRDQVVKAKLVLVDQVIEEVAGLRGVGLPVEELARRIGHAFDSAWCGVADQIAQVFAAFVGSGDVPAAEPVLDRDGVPDDVAAETFQAGTATGGRNDDSAVKPG